MNESHSRSSPSSKNYSSPKDKRLRGTGKTWRKGTLWLVGMEISTIMKTAWKSCVLTASGPSSWVGEVGGSQVHYFELCGKVEVSLGYMEI